MSGPISPWSKDPPAEGTAEARAARLLGQLDAPRTLTEDERARISQALAKPSVQGAGPRRARWFGGVVVLTAAAAAAWWGSTLRATPEAPLEVALRPAQRERSPTEPSPSAVNDSLRASMEDRKSPPPEVIETQRTPARQRSSSAPRAPRIAATPPPAQVPSALPETIARQPAPRQLPPASEVTPSPGVAPITELSPLEREARSLAAVVRLLRDEDAPSAALSALAGHRAEFPNGLLRLEADLVELDAHLAAGSRSEALALLGRLDPLNDPALPRRTEWLVLEAELLAEEARCDRAESRFDAALTAAAAPSLVERALWGKAHCLGRRGELGEARRALEDYLRRFPGGRYAEQARHELGR